MGFNSAFKVLIYVDSKNETRARLYQSHKVLPNAYLDKIPYRLILLQQYLYHYAHREMSKLNRWWEQE
jgi:hypothetical protein